MGRGSPILDIYDEKRRRSTPENAETQYMQMILFLPIAMKNLMLLITISHQYLPKKTCHQYLQLTVFPFLKFLTSQSLLRELPIY